MQLQILLFVLFKASYIKILIFVCILVSKASIVKNYFNTNIHQYVPYFSNSTVLHGSVGILKESAMLTS
jgi:hypothetical protein